MADRRAEALAAVLEDVRARLAPGLAFVLWDGRRVPADADPHATAIAIRDPGAVARLLRRPRLDTFVRLHLGGRIDFENGGLLELARLRPAGKAGRILRTLDRRRLARGLAAFAFAPGGEPLMAAAGPGDGALRDGSEATNKANVAHHYDVSNAFYALFLDPGMVYTCAYFDGWHDDLARAQRDKLEMVCRKLRLAPGERLLDIGCGWGALLMHAAEHHGAVGVGVTLSEAQAALARARIAQRGLAGRIEIRLADYTRMEDRFDKICSIGMFEQVGLANHATYFAAVHRLLQPGGLYLHHAITRRARASERAFRKMPAEYRALTRYIFPGGELDHIGMTVKNLEVHGFEVHDVEGWREHYARTTRLWTQRLQARRAEAVAEAGERVTRAWLLYLAGVSLAFERRGAYIFQTLASRRTRDPSPLPPTRRDLYR